MAQYINENPGILELTIQNTDKAALQKITEAISGIRQRVSEISRVGNTITIPLRVGENPLDVQGQTERAIASLARVIHKSLPTLHWNHRW